MSFTGRPINDDVAIALENNLSQAQRRIRTALKEHTREELPPIGELCNECSCWPDGPFVYWPCPTVWALTEEPS